MTKTKITNELKLEILQKVQNRAMKNLEKSEKQDELVNLDNMLKNIG